jgi:hypothetical protein
MSGAAFDVAFQRLVTMMPMAAARSRERLMYARWAATFVWFIRVRDLRKVEFISV